jgi:hypothetical protein
MPTHKELQTFWDDWQHLRPEQKEQFHKARRKFVFDLRTGKGFRASLRVKRVERGKAERVYEITWAPDGRATFQYGAEVVPGEQHIIWRRIGGHEILDEP